MAQEVTEDEEVDGSDRWIISDERRRRRIQRMSGDGGRHGSKGIFAQTASASWSDMSAPIHFTGDGRAVSFS